ncbi:MAG: type II toxin-antitoxin system VapB family antitoxin [Silvibacterium sp.]|nr:type II toxin-antitoxin system VapB family antitoxin [Silvibacterium sp.]
MALYIKNPNVEKSARRLARLTGESLTEATERAIEERLARLQPIRHHGRGATQLEKDLLRIAIECAALPNLDTRSADEILGYDAGGNHPLHKPESKKLPRGKARQPGLFKGVFTVGPEFFEPLSDDELY